VVVGVRERVVRLEDLPFHGANPISEVWRATTHIRDVWAPAPGRGIAARPPVRVGEGEVEAPWKKSPIGEPVAAAGTAYKVVMRCGLAGMLPLVGAGVAVGG
jgi:hypothetical protein